MVTMGEAHPGSLAETLADLPLVDHHVHGALRAAVDRPTFESMITEGPRPHSAGTAFDSQVGFAIRRWCAPLLGLQPHAPAEEYWARRCELGEDEVNRLETLAEGLLGEVDSGRAFVAGYPTVLEEATRGAVGTKSIIAYRAGFDVDPARPGDAEVAEAVDRLLGSASGRVRIED